MNCLVLVMQVVFLPTVKNEIITDITERLLDDTVYKNYIRPNSGKEPVIVIMNLNINKIISLSETNMEFTVTLYLRQNWIDTRLSYHDYYNESITLHPNLYEKLWIPDTFVRNIKSGSFHSISVPNRLIRLSPTGNVLYSQRLTLTLNCEMELANYPMDNQTCSIEFGSYAYTTRDIQFIWRENISPIEFKNVTQLYEYDIPRWTHHDCKINFTTGEFPCIRSNVHMKRRLRSFVLSYYLPSSIVVVASWISFWIDLESTPARTSLCILTVLTITTQSISIQNAAIAQTTALRLSFDGVSSRVLYHRLISIWMSVCLVFVFLAFIEYSIVNTMTRGVRKRKESTNGVLDRQLSVTTTSTFLSMYIITPTNSASRMKGYCQKFRRRLLPVSFKEDPARCVERCSRFIFPFLFLIFNAVYWPFYMR